MDLIFKFSRLGIVILIKTVKLHQQNDVVTLNHPLQHHSKLGFIAAEEVQYRDKRSIQVLEVSEEGPVMRHLHEGSAQVRR